MSSSITFDSITKKFTQLEPEEKVCYVCGGNSSVDEHHYDCQYGKISPETVPLCRRCHRTYHNYGVNWFEDEYLDLILDVENKRRVLFGRPLIEGKDVQRSNYWNKKHGIKKNITFDSDSKRFIQEGISTENDTKGSQTPVFPFHLPRGEPLCGHEWVYEHLYDLMDYVPRIEIISPDLHLTVDVNSKKKMREVGKVLRELKVRKNNTNEIITLDPITKRFAKEVIL